MCPRELAERAILMLTTETLDVESKLIAVDEGAIRTLLLNRHIWIEPHGIGARARKARHIGRDLEKFEFATMFGLNASRDTWKAVEVRVTGHALLFEVEGRVVAFCTVHALLFANFSLAGHAFRKSASLILLLLLLAVFGFVVVECAFHALEMVGALLQKMNENT